MRRTCGTHERNNAAGRLWSWVRALCDAHALVQAPRLVEGQPQQAHVLQHNVGGADGTRE